VPFVRFVRDKRGVETTALLRTSGGRGKNRPRLLYWFRTPPDVHVGRAAIDDAAIVALEQAHPDVTFDWPQILHASSSLAAAGARRARVERAGQLRARPSGRGAQARPDEAEPAADNAPAPLQQMEHRRRSRRGGSRRRRKGGGATPPETDQ
jgi:hypothetical protein